MTSDFLHDAPRRVVTGIAPDGASIVVQDAPILNRAPAAGITVNQIWQLDSIPPSVLADDASESKVMIQPGPGAVVYLVTTFAPDESWNLDEGFAKSFAASGGSASGVLESSIPGLHMTDTFDIVTVISGELTGLFETGEVVLKQGDSIVQRGTKHAWRNRTSSPTTIVAVMFGATRTE